MKPTLMRFFVLIYLSIGLFNSPLLADIPSFDVITIEVEGTHYYIQMESQGKLQNNDLCLYDNEGNYIKDFSEIITNQILKEQQLSTFRRLEIIELKNIDKKIMRHQPSVLYNFVDPIDFTKIDIKNQINIISVIKGNTYGYICSKDLKTMDTSWLSDYEMEKIFISTFPQICDVSFYAIKNNLDSTEIKKIKTEFEALTKQQQSYESLLSKLYQEHIIMIGFCSC